MVNNDELMEPYDAVANIIHDAKIDNLTLERMADKIATVLGNWHGGDFNGELFMEECGFGE